MCHPDLEIVIGIRKSYVNKDALLSTSSPVISITKTCSCNKQSFFFALKIENFQLKNVDIFLIFAQNIDCGYTLEPPRRGGSNEYPQSMFWSKNKKNRNTPAYPSFGV